MSQRKTRRKYATETSGQKSQITVLASGIATGQVTLPFIIFSGKQINPFWTEDGVNGSRYAVSDNGWVDQEFFHHYWITDHFLSNVAAMVANPPVVSSIVMAMTQSFQLLTQPPQ